MRPVLFYILIILTCNNSLGQIESPYGRYSVISKNVRHLEERTVEYQLSILDQETSDTIFVAKNLRHSGSLPAPYWSKNNEYLIIENSVDIDVPRILYNNKRWHEVSTIVIWNIKENRKENVIEGFLLSRSKHFNPEDNVLIFYSVTANDTEKQTHVNVYDLDKHVSNKLHTLACHLRFAQPRLTFLKDPQRTIKINYFCNGQEGVELTELIEY